MSTSHSATPAGGQTRRGLPPARVPVATERPPRRADRLSIRRTTPGRRVLAATTWAALALAAVAFLLLIVGPRTGAYYVSVVLSDSMKPRWEAGDIVISRPERPDQIRVGQVISYNPPIDGRPSVTHRVIAISEPGTTPIVRTKGDANGDPDAWGAVRITHGPVQRVVHALPNVGWALSLLQGRIVGLAATVLAPMLLLVMLLWRIWRPSTRPARSRR